jgi:hypothetical protein
MVTMKYLFETANQSVAIQPPPRHRFPIKMDTSRIGLLDDYGSSLGHILKKLLGHVVGHPHATVRCCVAWEVASVHADGVVEAHKVRHGCIVKHLTRSDFIESDIGVVVDHLAGGFVFDRTVEGGFVILVFLDDFVITRRCAGIFFSRGDFGNADQLIAFVKIGLLLGAIDLDD